MMTGGLRLKPNTCQARGGNARSQSASTEDEKNVLAVPDDLYAHLEEGGQPTLAEVRNRLQTYTPTGEDLFYCIFFELIMVSITTKRAIAVVIYEDNGEVHEHIIRPHLKLEAWEESKDILREANSVYKNMEGEEVKCRFGPTDGAEPLELILVYKGQFYVCEGSFVGTASSLGKRPREEGRAEEKEGGSDRKRQEEGNYVQAVYDSFQCDDVVSDSEGGHGKKACGENGTTAREESELESDLPYSSPNDLGLFMDEFTAMLNGDM